MLPDYSTVPYVQPREMSAADIDAVVAAYVAAAKNALAAGFDGVELHSANGYLLEQFLRASSNQRTDKYGPGGLYGRATLTLRVIKALVDAVGADRVGVRLSPFGRFLIDPPSVEDDHPTYDVLVRELASIGIAYVHMIEPRMCTGNEETALESADASLDRWRKLWVAGAPGRVFMAAGGFNRQRALDHCAAHPDNEVVCIGRWWLANPDLVARFQADAPLNPYDRDTFYVGGDRGYTDYPVLKDVPADAPTGRARDGSRVFVVEAAANGTA